MRRPRRDDDRPDHPPAQLALPACRDDAIDDDDEPPGRLLPRGLTIVTTPGTSRHPYAALSVESIPELPPVTPQEDAPLDTPITLLESARAHSALAEDFVLDDDDDDHDDHGERPQTTTPMTTTATTAPAPAPASTRTVASMLDMRDMTIMNDAEMEVDEDDEEADDDRATDSDPESDYDHDDDDGEGEGRGGGIEEIPEAAIDFQVNRASVTRSGIIPCCVFVGRVTWGAIDWEICFGQKQLVRLHLSLLATTLYHKRRGLRGAALPWTLWREKRAERRVADAPVVQAYIRRLLADADLRNSEPLLSFLEVSPSRAMSRYGPSLKEGYVHMRMNGPFQLPLYSCFNRTIEALYRHLYRTWMRIAFISAVVTFILPVCLLIFTAFPRLFTGQRTTISANGENVKREVDPKQVLFGIVSILGLIFVTGFVYKFFDHRLGVIRRWVVLKPGCFAAYRKRGDKEPSEVFLFDKTFSARKGSYRQGVSWMPSGFVVGSRAGFIEIDTGHYYTRLTASIALALVCWAVIVLLGRLDDFKGVHMTGGVPITELPPYVNLSRPLDPDLFKNAYCGYYFHVPGNSSVRIRTLDRDAVVSFMKKPNETSIPTINYFFGSDDLKIGLFTSTAGPGSLVAVTKRVNPVTDMFLPSAYKVDVEDIGELALMGLNGTSLLQFTQSSYLCRLPIEVSRFRWSTIGYYVLMLLVGGVIVASSGLALNYLIAYAGLWHAHVRRDHWYRCIKRLQKVKRQETEYRYHSFAPERNSVPKFEYPPDSSCGPLSARKKASSEGSVQSGASFVASHPPVPSSIAWHVDGEDTYEAMYKAISDAKFEILIAGWWVTPDLYLLRPGRKLPRRENEPEKNPNETQLRNLLLLKAQQGVKIYVLIYREVKLALTLNSAYTKRSLMLHPNIRVLRDPIFQIQSLGFWSHHEKIVCVDQSLAFVGGLDLCFGRYDHSGHPLSDPGGDKIEDQCWPGKDYSNPIIKDFIRVNKPFEDLIDRSAQPRMPWHDVHCSVSGPPVQDIAYHFIQRWNFVCSKNDYQLRTGWCICLRSRRFKFLPKCLLPMDFNGWTLRYPSSETTALQDSLTTVQLAQDESMELDEPFQVVRHRLFNSPDQCSSTSDSRAVCHSTPVSANSSSGVGMGKQVVALKHSAHRVRSVSLWSAGVPTERSIHEAYVDVISKAKHFIYIENQFFISGLHSNGVVSNRILQALVDRIERAVKCNEVFRVFVVMPLLPAFEGNIRSEELTNLHAVMHWQFETISRGKHSLFAALSKFTDEHDKYVSFFGLRKYGMLPNGCVSTEQIYIHSKLLIADDQYAIIGSANINDRSMNGDRDSEIAMVIEDAHFEDGLMNERPYRRGIAVGALRMQLFREHLGLAENDATTFDPAAEWSWRRIRNIAQKNTKIFETVFDCAPSNNMTSFRCFNNIEVTQIFENQRINVLKGRRHAWCKENLKDGDYSPWTDVNGIPIDVDKINLNDYVVDRYKDKSRRKLFSMDHDGWCYARNFSVFQEARMQNFRKRDKLQHFMTDRLVIQVRRRRWVKKDSGLLPPAALLRNSSMSESDDEEHGRFHSLWRRFHRSDSSATLSRANSFTNSRAGGAHSLTSSMLGLGDASYPNSPAISAFRPPPGSPSDEYRHIRDSQAFQSHSVVCGNNRGSVATPGATRPHHGFPRDSDHFRHSTDSSKGGILKKWASFMDQPMDLGRRSRFKEEYFSKDRSDEDPFHSYGYAHSVHNDEPLLESGRGSIHSVKSMDAGTGGKLSTDLGAGECQIGHLQTAATVRKEDEGRARGQLSEIRGHLVEFPTEFLCEEILKPSILPRDIHI